MNFWERMEKLDRRWIYLAVGVAVIIPFLQPAPLPISITPEAQSLYDAVEALLENGDQDVVLVLEVKVDGAAGHVRLFCYLGDAGVVKAVPGKHLHRGLQYAIVFLSFKFRRHPCNPGACRPETTPPENY